MRPELVHVPRGVTWNTPWSPPGEHWSIDGLRPAPIEEETTPMCTFGKPPGSPFKTSMKTGNWAVSFVWIGLIEVELSTMKTMSRFRLMACWNRSLVFDEGAGSGFASRRALHAQSAGIAAASTTQ